MISYPITLPSTPTCSSFRWNPESAVMGQESEFTFHNKKYAWDGQRRSAQVSYPPMSFDDAKIWQAAIYSLNGIEGTFYLKDTPIWRTLRGVGTVGAILVKGASQTGQDLLTDGWQVSTANVLKKGDWVSISNRLYTTLADVSTNGGGEATLTLWPDIRTAYADNTAVAIGSNAQGLFELTQWPDFFGDASRLMSGFSLGVQEVIG